MVDARAATEKEEEEAMMLSDVSVSPTPMEEDQPRDGDTEAAAEGSDGSKHLDASGDEESSDNSDTSSGSEQGTHVSRAF